MVRHSPFPPESFDEILAWLNPDREVAASIYVQLCADLTRMFAWNRCADPEGLTDEVIDRVGWKVHEVRPTYKGDPRLFFYGVARNLIRESSKRTKSRVSLEDVNPPSPAVVNIEDDSAIMREECLQSCLQRLPAEKRALILAYYAKEKQAKIDHRSRLAERLGISVQSLRVRSYRIRSALEECIEECLRRRGRM